MPADIGSRRNGAEAGKRLLRPPVPHFPLSSAQQWAFASHGDEYCDQYAQLPLTEPPSLEGQFPAEASLATMSPFQGHRPE